MFWYICFACSLLLLLNAGIPWIITPKNKKKPPINKRFYVTLAFIAGAGFSMFLPVYADYFKETGSIITQIIKTFFLSIHNTIRLFVIDSDFEMIKESTLTLAPFLKNAYPILSAVIFIIAPILTFGFVLSFFKELVASFMCWCSRKKDAYVFTELNEYSITLASDIRKNHPDALIVFTDVYKKEDDETMSELHERAQEIRAVCFKKDITVVKFKKHKPNKKLIFFILNEKEDENSKSFLHLNNTFKDRENTEIFLFSKNVISDLLISSFRDTKIKIRRIDYAQSLVSRTLYEQGYELLFERALPAKEDKNVKVISAVIVGLGQYGKAMTKALTWYCQMDGYRIKINAFDDDEKAQSKFESETQELLNPNYNGFYVDGEAQYCINIHSGMDYKTKEFDEKIKAIDDATFVFVSLGSDAANIECALKLRTLFERIGVKPCINTIVYDSKQKELLVNAKNHTNTPYEFNLIGGIDSTYSEAVVLDTELEEAGIEINRGYSKPDEDGTYTSADNKFWKYDYNYRSSIASALHQMARIKCKIPGADKTKDEATAEETALIEVIEHRRWNAYMRTEGFVWGEKRNDLAKVHHNIVVFDKLSEEDKRKDSKVGLRRKK